MSNFIQNTFTPYNIISTIIALWGIGIAIKNKRKIDFNYEKKSFNLIDESKNKFPGLEVKYAGTRIEDFSVTQIAIWNCGNRIIDSKDFATSGALTITSIGNNQILDAAIMNVSDVSNDIYIENRNNKISINFEYLNPRQGVSLQIIHTGNSSDLKLEYTLKESRNKRSTTKNRGKASARSKNIIKVLFAIDSLLSNKKFKQIYSVVTMLLMFFFFLSLTLVIKFYPQNTHYIIDESSLNELMIAMTTITILLGILLMLNIFTGHSRVPKELQSFESLLTQSDTDDDDQLVHN